MKYYKIESCVNGEWHTELDKMPENNYPCACMMARDVLEEKKVDARVIEVEITEKIVQYFKK